MVITIDDRCAASRLDLDGYDFIREPPLLPPIVRAFLAANRVSILLYARDLVVGRAFLGGFGHEETAHRVAQPLIQRIFQCACPSFNPERSPRMTCGAWLMFSIPPVSTMSASPVRM